MIAFYMSMIETKGDKNKFSRLYDRYEGSMYNIAYSILHDQYLAEDAVQEALLKLIKYLPDIFDIECHKTKALIVIIIKSAAIDIYRKRKKQYETEVTEVEEEVAAGELPLDHMIAEESYYEFKTKLGNLNKEYREIILLKYLYEMSNREIADYLCVSDSVVRQRICRAKRAVKKLMEE